MWIRTQNKYILANANSFRIRKDCIDDWVYYAINGHYDRYEQELGIYSTKEKALRERIEYLYNAIINDDSNDEDLMIYEKEIKVLEKALDKACKYTHNNGLNGCPANFDIGAVDKKKKKECILCKFHCDSEKYFFNKEYEKKSKECWKEYFLKGKRK